MQAQRQRSGASRVEHGCTSAARGAELPALGTAVQARAKSEHTPPQACSHYSQSLLLRLHAILLVIRVERGLDLVVDHHAPLDLVVIE